MRQSIGFICLGVKDVHKSAAFYEGLGWKRSSISQGDWIVFSLQGIALALYPRDLLAEDANVPDGPSGFSGITLSYLTKSEEEVVQVLEEAEKRGATITKQALKTDWGGYNGYFTDPDGHLIEVAYGPMFQFDENGILNLPE